MATSDEKSKPCLTRHVVPHQQGWANLRGGASRATSVHDTKREAEQAAREQSRREGSELVVHGLDGKIQLKDSHGHDSCPPRDDKTHQDQVNATAWKACDTFRGVVDAGQYKDYILVMLFVKYISDVWKDHLAQYQKQYGDDVRVRRRMERERFRLPEVVLKDDDDKELERFQGDFEGLYLKELMP